MSKELQTPALPSTSLTKMIHYYITSITYIKDPLPFVVKAYYEETVGGGGGVVGHEKYGELLCHVIVNDLAYCLPSSEMNAPFRFETFFNFNTYFITI